MTGASTDPLAIGIDLGGTLLRIALVERSGEVVWRKRVRSEGRESRDRLLARLDSLLEETVDEAAPRPIQGVGLALAGPVDPDTGVLYAPPYLPTLDGFSLKAHWESSHPWPVYAGNDATLAALGEYMYGLGAGAKMLVYLTISTGIGAGIVTDGQLLTGAYGMAGELGHIIVDPHGPPCACGSQGCLGALASGTGIAENAVRRLRQGQPSALTEMTEGDLSRITSETVFLAASRNDMVATGVVQEAALALGCGFVTILHSFNPDRIVLGGGVSQEWERLRPIVESYVDAHVMDHIKKLGFTIEVSPLGDDAGILGAAALVWSSAGS